MREIEEAVSTRMDRKKEEVERVCPPTKDGYDASLKQRAAVRSEVEEGKVQLVAGSPSESLSHSRNSTAAAWTRSEQLQQPPATLTTPLVVLPPSLSPSSPPSPPHRLPASTISPC